MIVKQLNTCSDVNLQQGSSGGSNLCVRYGKDWNILETLCTSISEWLETGVVDVNNYPTRFHAAINTQTIANFYERYIHPNIVVRVNGRVKALYW